MSDINVTVTNAGSSNVTATSSSTYTATVGNGGAVNVAVGTVSPGNATVVAGTLAINSTTTLSPGASAYVKNVGTAYAASLDIGIPSGNASTVQVGSTTTLDSGNASVTGTTNGSTLTLAFAIPRGTNGINGTNGTNGVTPTFTASASTLSAGSNATVTATTTNGGANVALAFGIPQGAAGSGGGSNLTLSDATPSALGTASAGTSTLASRSDHTHSLPTIAYANLSGVPANFPTNTTLVSGLSAGYSAANHGHNYVTSLNNLTGGLTLAAGSNVTLTTNGSTLTLSSSAGGLGANDAVDGGDYIGEILNGITFSVQPSSQTLNSSLTLGSWSNAVNTGLNPIVLASNASAFLAANATIGSSGVVVRAALSGNGQTWSATNGTLSGGPTYSQTIDLPLAPPVWDGSRWVTLASHGFSSEQVCVAVSGNGAVSFVGNVMSFVDESGSLGSSSRIVYGNGLYLRIVGKNVYRSTDCVSWSAATPLQVTVGGLTSASLNVFSAFFSNGAFFVGGLFKNYINQSEQKILRSTDGYTWAESNTGYVFPYAAASGQRIVAGSATLNSSGIVVDWLRAVVVSTDGITWNRYSVPRRAYSIFWTGERFVAFDNESTNEYIWSTDGQTWTVATLPETQGWSGVSATSSAWVVQYQSNGSRVFNAQTPITSASANLTVSASASGGAAVSYQWQSSLDAGTTWANVSNATSTTLSLTGLTTANSGTRYRASASATGAATVYSQSATLTVTG
jgi:hypothetical protein